MLISLNTVFLSSDEEKKEAKEKQKNEPELMNLEDGKCSIRPTS